MTIKDIAKESGYGVGTVSRVLNNNPNVSKKARDRIMEVVNAHNYQPNANARHLKMQAQQGIAIIVKGAQNLLFSSILEKMNPVIEERGYISYVTYIDQDASEIVEASKLIEDKKPQGLIFLGSNFDQYSIEEIETLNLPCVTVTSNSISYNLKNLSSLSIDDSAAAMYVMDYLHQCGHEHIGIIGGDPNLSSPVQARLMGCRMAMIRVNGQIDMDKQYAYSRFSMESGYKAAKKLIEKYPEMTAVFAMSDLIAMGAIRAFIDMGKKVPEDISVVGFDGISSAEYFVPRLATVRQNAERFAVRGAEIVIYAIESGGQAVHEIIPFEFQKGESVKVLRK